MSTNVSKQKRNDLTEKIKKIHKYIAGAKQDENTRNFLVWLSEIEKEINTKKFGLVFEEHREAIDDTLETHTPVLTENKKLFIGNGGQVNFLIEGDNLAALQLLLKTHKGRIDVIYIDPPYNTGKKNEWKYNDHWVDENDSYRHSKWLSFMEKRLLFAKNLLTEEGVVFISIDDNEQTHLKILCDNVFGEGNVEQMIWKKNDFTDGVLKLTKRFRIEHEYIITCHKEKNKVEFNRVLQLSQIKNEYPNPDNDTRGQWISTELGRSENKSKKDSSNYYAIESPTGKKWFRQWLFDKDEMKCLIKDERVYFGKDGTACPRLKKFVNEERPKAATSILQEYGSARSGMRELEELFQNRVFDYPKPTDLISYLLKLIKKKSLLAIDFFAGSGTTGHAVLKLNKEDGGKRRFILCTNNENNICRDVTYERIKRVIKKEEYPASLKYYKIDYIPISDKIYYEYADELLEHIRELVELENAINFTRNDKIAIVLTDEEMDNFVTNIKKYKNCRKLYRAHNVLVSGKQREALKNAKIRVNVIPDYYYGELET